MTSMKYLGNRNYQDMNSILYPHYSLIRSMNMAKYIYPDGGLSSHQQKLEQIHLN